MNKLNVVLDKYHVLLYSSQTAYIYKFVHAGNTQGPIGCACTILALAELWFSNPFHPMVCQLQSKPVKVHNFFDEMLFGYVGLTVCKHILYFHLTIIKWKYDMCLQSVNRYKGRMKGKDFFLLSGSHQLRKVIKLWTFSLREGAAGWVSPTPFHRFKGVFPHYNAVLNTINLTREKRSKQPI